ncbi:MAG TPA: radical SAM/SPASM domain-containing protein [Thermoanaerobaculia bacterium]|nr:radical SAM/SPASM domain-containing protein [Thermoanaerobaculia bacterium]
MASPYLHIGPDRVYNPITDKLILETEPGYPELRALLAGAVGAEHLGAELFAMLSQGGWLVERAVDASRLFRLKYVAIEANSHCNQSCYFCPVSIAPRETYQMPTELYRRILSEVAPYRETVEAVFMINYNEPTADPRFVELVGMIREHGLPPATLTNGTGLTPGRTDRLLELGGLRFLSINLSTLDRERYRRDRGGDHLNLVLKNVDYAASRPLAEQMDIVVLGTGNEEHREDFERIRERYEGSRFTVKYFEVNDRAGYLTIGLKAAKEPRRLCGCEYVGSRPLQHLHVTPRGQAVLCCQDYNETVVVGDLNLMSVDEVLTGPAMAQARRWAYGVEEAPDRFLCRNCRYALTRPR